MLNCAFETELKINSHDCDYNGVLRPSGYMRYLQECANLQVESGGFGYDDCLKKNCAFILSRVSLSVHQPLFPGDRVLCRTAPCQSKGVTFYRNSELYKNGVINTEESKKIIAFSSTSAPLFVIGTLGVFMLDNVSYGVIILFSHYLSAIVTGLVFCNVRRLKATKSDVKPRVKPLPDNVIGDSINDSVLSVLSVGGLIAIFSLVIDVLYDLKFFDLFGNYSPLAVGFFEMTRGAKEIIKNPPSTGALLAALTGFTSFGGLCIFLQATTFLKDAKVKSSYYFLVKVFQGLVGAGIAYLVSLALP